MSDQLELPKYSVGVGDRFAHQAKAQLQACVLAAKQGVEVIPVWNKSNREHTIIGSEPATTRAAADTAVKTLGWNKPYFVDADHINLKTVDRFAQPCDFFTIDVADLIGEPADSVSVQAFADKHTELVGEIRIPGVERSFNTDSRLVTQVANQYLAAVQEAGRIYRHIEETKGKGNFVAEVSMDETDSPQTPVELLIILAAIADEGIPIQTIAPKFTGRFNKGVDYSGNLKQFAQEFSDDVAVIAYAIKQYGLPKNLKLSVHSGSDKFSIYKPIREAIKKFNAGVHLKTAGTTWLEELIGLAEAGGEGLALAKEIYAEAYAHHDELTAPYAAVIDIDPAKLPSPEEVNKWTSEQFVSAIRHVPDSPQYNSSMRQLLHVGFKVAAKMGQRYLNLLEQMEDTVARNVTTNLFDRHIKPLFLGA
ncbi:MAG TPA: tagaturonate epimerase family protein [Bryobacteraceae bacterium]|nr:tagaturonate epimerase family protein [Bryobacteraceae bacterium]